MDGQQQQPLRHVVVGVGAIVFEAHRPGITSERSQIVGVCDIREDAARERAAEFGCPWYLDYREMLAEQHPDVAVVTTPHYLHAEMAIACLRAGCHVLVEKPMALEVAEADAMVDAQAEAKRLLAVVFQHRHRPEVRAARRLIRQGRIGEIQRLRMIASWPRTERYYAMATWRATWWGEGGGVLMNQSPHDLDLVCHLMGAPSRVAAWTQTRVHKIEVEDTASAMLEWPNGATGFLHMTTAEGKTNSEVEIIGTGGILSIGQGTLSFQEFETDAKRFLLETDEIWRGPALHPVEVELEAGEGNHAAVYRNLHAAILDGTPLGSDGREGRNSLELANAINYSSHLRSEVTLPIDRARYSEFLAELKRGSTRR